MKLSILSDQSLESVVGGLQAQLVTARRGHKKHRRGGGGRGGYGGKGGIGDIVRVFAREDHEEGDAFGDFVSRLARTRSVAKQA